MPAGVIRETVTWYVLRLQSDDQQIVIGRPAPPDGQKTCSEVFLQVGSNVEVPDYADLMPNTNASALTTLLTEMVGIQANEHTPPPGQSRQPLRATISHAKFYLFQPQYRIADRTVLFYRQEEDFVPQAIKDTLPFFLGAVGDERYDRILALRRAKRELKLLNGGSQRRMPFGAGTIPELCLFSWTHNRPVCFQTCLHRRNSRKWLRPCMTASHGCQRHLMFSLTSRFGDYSSNGKKCVQNTSISKRKSRRPRYLALNSRGFQRR